MSIVDALRSTVQAIKVWVDANKVDKVDGKGLSTHDYTTEEKTQLANLGTLVGNTAVSDQISNAVDECITDLSVSGAAITYTKGDGRTGTPGGDNLVTYNAKLGTVSSGATVTFTIPTNAITDLANGTIEGLMLYYGDTEVSSEKGYSRNYARFAGQTSGTDATKPLLTVRYQAS